MNKLSTKNLNLIPPPIKLKEICKSISALEAIICPEWEFRYYSYQKDWNKNEELCEMRNGHGDQMLILFSDDGVCINGFAHESEMNGWKRVAINQKKSILGKLLSSKNEVKTELIQEISKGVITNLPSVFNDFIFGEPIKSIGTTFCIWQTNSDKKWKIGELDLPENHYKDGSSDLLQLLDGNPLSYKNWAEEYYEEVELKLELVEKLYNNTHLTKVLAMSINATLEDFEKLKSDLDKIGYQHNL